MGGAANPAVPRVLSHLQRQLEAIHDERGFAAVGDFLCDRRALEAAGARVQAPEEVFVFERPAVAGEEPEIDLALYLAPELFERLRGRDPEGRSGLSLVTEELASFAAVAEGVSHVLYLLGCARASRPVSQLELEVQGEADKFATSALHLWGRGRRWQIGELWQRLFGALRLRPGMTGDERARYTEAFAVGRHYAQRLIERHVISGQLGGFLRDLRQTYRLGADEKLRAMAA